MPSTPSMSASALGAGPGVGGVERQLQRLDPCRRPRTACSAARLAGGRAAPRDRPTVASSCASARSMLDDERGLDELAGVAVVAQGGAPGVELGEPLGQLAGSQPGPCAARPRPVRRRPGGDRSSPRTSAMALAAVAAGRGVEQREQALARGGELLLVELEVDELGFEGVDVAGGRRPARPRAGGVGLQAGDDVGVEELAAVALQRPPPLGDDGAETPRLARAAARREPGDRRRRRSPRAVSSAPAASTAVSRRASWAFRSASAAGGVELGRGERP